MKPSSRTSAGDEVPAAADPRCVPVSLAGPPPLGPDAPRPDYPAADHETWRRLVARQRALLPGRACPEFLDGLDRLSLPDHRIPALAEVDAAVQAATGWRVARVPGLLDARDFFSLLARRVFPSTDYVRAAHELDYTPAPDMFHDVFGHAPLLTLPSFADFYQRFGAVAAGASPDGLRRLERFYWFTVEFGLIRTPDGLRVYGNGILSSPRELRHSLEGAVIRRRFDPEEMTARDYEVSDLQPLLFVIDSFEELDRGFRDWVARSGLE